MLPSAIPSRSEPSEGLLLPSPLASSFRAPRWLLSRSLCRTFSLSLVSRRQHTQGSVHGPHPSSPRNLFPGGHIIPWALNIISHTPLWLRPPPTPEPQAHLSAAHSTAFPGGPRGTSNPALTVQSSKICSISGTGISISPGHSAKTRVLILESALSRDAHHHPSPSPGPTVRESLGHGAQGGSHMLGRRGPLAGPWECGTPLPAARIAPPQSLIMPCHRSTRVPSAGSELGTLSTCPLCSTVSPCPLSSPHTPEAQSTSLISMCLEWSLCVGLLHKFIHEQDMAFLNKRPIQGGFPLMEHKCAGINPT